MAEPQSQHWFIECRPQQLLDALGRAFAPETGTAETVQRTILDSFGWAVWHSGALLSLQPATATYCLQRPGAADLCWTPPANAGPPRFWWDFDDPALRDALSALIGLWALRPVAELRLARRSLTLRDEQSKIVIRGTLTEHARDDQTQHYLTLEPMRGFAAEFERACQCLQTLADPIPELNDRTLLREQGIEPLDLRDRSGFGLTAAMPTEEAVRQMAGQMLERARLFEQGLIDDVDTEFLHQFRVSLRKTRSLLNLMKRALPAADQRYLKRALARIAGRTGDMRDLDVLLLSESRYREMVPDRMQSGMDTLFALIAADRIETYQSVARFLQSTHYRNEIQAILGNVRRPPTLDAPLAAKPILAIASRKIRKRYGTIATMFAHLEPGAPDHEIHAIRIECKKLRYLMEFFSELYARRDTAPLLKTLKGLQDSLGDFNDYSVQQNFLLDLAARHPADTALGAAVGALAVVLEGRHQAARARADTDLAAFADAAIARQFEQTFTP